MTTRKNIAAKAREYVGTPFKHQGRLKGIACDCVGLGYMIAEDLGLHSRNGKAIHKHDNSVYTAQPHGSQVLDTCRQLLTEKPIAEMQEGDLLCMKMPTVPCHVGIVSTLYVGTRDQCLGIIHSYAPAQKVVETILDAKLRARIVAVFNFPGVTS